jgi:hypothetical protein
MPCMTEQQLANVKLGKPFRWVRKGSAINRSEEDAIAYAVDGVPSNLQVTLHAEAPRDPWHYEVKSNGECIESPQGFGSKDEALRAVKSWLMSHA